MTNRIYVVFKFLLRQQAAMVLNKNAQFSIGKWVSISSLVA